MAGKLVKVNSVTSDGSATSLQVTGINSDHVYMAVSNLLQTQNNNEEIRLRVTKGGTEDSTSNYDYAGRKQSSVTFANKYAANQTSVLLHDNVDDANGGGQNILYLYNFNSSSEFTFLTYETVEAVSNQEAGSSNSACHTVASASDGIKIFGGSGGTFISGANITLYKIL